MEELRSMILAFLKASTTFPICHDFEVQIVSQSICAAS